MRKYVIEIRKIEFLWFLLCFYFALVQILTFKICFGGWTLVRDTFEIGLLNQQAIIISFISLKIWSIFFTENLIENLIELFTENLLDMDIFYLQLLFVFCLTIIPAVAIVSPILFLR